MYQDFAHTSAKHCVAQCVFNQHVCSYQLTRKWVWTRAQNELNTVFCLGFLKIQIIQPSKQTFFWWEFIGLASPQVSLHAVTNNGKIKKRMLDSTATSSFTTAVFNESELESQGEVPDDREQPWWSLQAKGEGEEKGKSPKFLSHPKHPLYHHGSSSKKPETCQQITAKLVLYKKNRERVTAENSKREKKNPLNTKDTVL